LLSIHDFVHDRPTVGSIQRPDVQKSPAEDLIDGVTITPLSLGADDRRSLHELLTLRDESQEPIVHVYQVSAQPKSIRAWVYHKHQSDRLAFTNGEFRVVLYPTIIRVCRTGSETQRSGGSERRAVTPLRPAFCVGLLRPPSPPSPHKTSRPSPPSGATARSA
jgi:hypothetical protein